LQQLAGQVQVPVWKTIAGKRISATMAQTLVRKGRTALLKGFKSKAEKPFDARLKVDNGEVRFEFEGRNRS
jgi:DNA topoisomerase-3